MPTSLLHASSPQILRYRLTGPMQWCHELNGDGFQAREREGFERGGLGRRLRGKKEEEMATLEPTVMAEGAPVTGGEAGGGRRSISVDLWFSNWGF